MTKTNAWAALEGVSPADQVSCLPRCAALVRLHLEFGPVLVFQYIKDMDILKSVQQRATRMVKGLGHFSHEERLRAGASHPGEEKAQREIDNAYKQLKGECREDRTRLFPVVPSDKQKALTKTNHVSP